MMLHNKSTSTFLAVQNSSIGDLVTHSLTHSLTHSVTFSNLIDATLACDEDANSKLVEVVTVNHVDDEKCVDNSLLQIW